ncbi:MAG: hypothetical protein JSS30_00910 [Verrucomicrobia bacterium]|nr:hypothetical protein [Verrucomicrobiota bacterium]
MQNRDHLASSAKNGTGDNSENDTGISLIPFLMRDLKKYTHRLTIFIYMLTFLIEKLI